MRTTLKSTGRQPTLLEQMVINNVGLVTKRSPNEAVVIHHISFDEPHRLQLEVERRCPVNGITFQRLLILR